MHTSESGDVWKISWNLKIVATSVDTSNKNFQNSQNHIVVVFSGSHDIEISADFSDVSWFTDSKYNYICVSYFMLETSTVYSVHKKNDI